MPLRIGTELPELDGATEWLNGETSREELIGSPTLIHFWSVSCYICKNNMPTLEQWKSEYSPKGLKVIAIHMPRAEDELDVARVRETMAQFNMTEPCAVDNDHTLGERYQTGGLWPAYFLFDSEGKMRSRAAGDAGLKMIDGSLKKLMEPEAVTA
jgi:thiol-disulfide isomerase/thioredoxin